MVTYSKLFKDPEIKMKYSNIMNREDVNEDSDRKLLFMLEVRSLGELICTSAVVSTDVVSAAKKVKKMVQENCDDRYNYHITPMAVEKIDDKEGGIISQLNKEVYVSSEVGEG